LKYAEILRLFADCFSFLLCFYFAQAATEPYDVPVVVFAAVEADTAGVLATAPVHDAVLGKEELQLGQ
jgi:hypothetical protein